MCRNFTTVDQAQASLEHVAIVGEGIAGMEPSYLHWMIADGTRLRLASGEPEALLHGGPLRSRGASVAAGANASSEATKFPSFTGKDLDGNDVSSDELFSKNKLTVMNFWFATCKPCVGELGDLENPNKELAEKGGQVVGVNSFTLDGNKDEIADAKDVLSKKGVTYKNIWFKSESEAGKFTSNLFSFPTIYVIDQNGNIVGEPIVGAISSAEQRAALDKLIDRRLRIASSKNSVKHSEDRVSLCEVVRCSVR